MKWEVGAVIEPDAQLSNEEMLQMSPSEVWRYFAPFMRLKSPYERFEWDRFSDIMLRGDVEDYNARECSEWSEDSTRELRPGQFNNPTKE